MFYGKLKEYAVAAPVQTMGRYNYETTSYQDQGTARFHIILQDRSLMNSNDLDIYKSSLIGYTTDGRIKEGWKIDNKYIVTSATKHRMMNVCYLKRLEDGR